MQLRLLFAAAAVGAALGAGLAGERVSGGASARSEQALATERQAPLRKLTPRSQTLIIPVRGVPRAQLHDTWGAPREGGGHQGVDIMAPLGADVLAAVDGRIARFFESERGGITIYQFDRNERFVFYYAHLSARVWGLEEGDLVRQGDVIGRVGMTGNASTPHLHFEIQRLTEARRWWEAEALNAYPFLISGRAPV